MWITLIICITIIVIYVLSLIFDSEDECRSVEMEKLDELIKLLPAMTAEIKKLNDNFEQAKLNNMHRSKTKPSYTKA